MVDYHKRKLNINIDTFKQKKMPADKFAREIRGRIFNRLSNSLRNQQSTHGAYSFLCQTCGKIYNREESYLRHTRNHIETSDEKSYDSETVDDSKNYGSDD